MAVSFAVFATLLATVGPSVALPVAIALYIGTSGRGRGHGGRRPRRRRRRDRTVRHGFDGTREIWDLRGVRIVLEPHRLTVRSGRIGSMSVSIHEVQGLEIDERGRVRLRALDGRSAPVGRATAPRSALRSARVQIQQAIELRRRGQLEDKIRMQHELHPLRDKQVVP